MYVSNLLCLYNNIEFQQLFVLTFYNCSRLYATIVFIACSFLYSSIIISKEIHLLFAIFEVLSFKSPPLRQNVKAMNLFVFRLVKLIATKKRNYCLMLSCIS